MTKYTTDELKSILKKGDVILTHGSSWISRMIQKVTQSHWNHVVIYDEDGYVIESNWGGVVRSHVYNYYAGKDIMILRHKTASKTKLRYVVESAKYFIGREYDYFQIIELLWLYLTGRRGNSRQISSKNKFICSELVGRAFHDNDLPVIAKYKYTELSPGDWPNSKNFVKI